MTSALAAAPSDGFEKLIPAAIGGNRVAADRLLHGVLPRVRNLIRYLTRGDSDVDDICQEALLQILRSLPNYRGEGTFPAWCDRIVCRVTFAALRRRRKLHSQHSGQEAETVGDQGAASHATDNYLKRRKLAALLDQLPDEQRTALVLHHVVGFTVPEVAEELEVPLETVRTRLRTALQRLRDTLGLELGEAGAT